MNARSQQQQAVMDEANIRSVTLYPRFNQNLHGQRVKLKLSRGVKHRMRTSKKELPSTWLPKHRAIVDGSDKGAYRPELVPHLKKIVDTFAQPYVREIWFCGVEQSGKTNALVSCMDWTIDCAPGDFYFLMPNDNALKKVWNGKVIPSIKQSARLKRYITKNQNNISLEKLQLEHLTGYPASAQSPASMASMPAKYCFRDEIDKNTETVGKETDAITLTEKRLRLYKGTSKQFNSSTPAGMFIYKGTMSCDQVWQGRAKCPHCGDLIKMTPDHLVIPDGCNHETVDQHHISYSCNSCGVEWSGEEERQHAIAGGWWVCIKGADLVRPRKVGFHHPGWFCKDITLEELAAAWLKTKTGKIAAKIDWDHGYEAIDYKPKTATSETSVIHNLCDDRARDLVPENQAGLFMQVDTQQVGFYYIIRSVGFGVGATKYEIRHGYVQEFEDLVKIAALDFEDVHGKKYRVLSAVIDSGGTRKAGENHSRTAAVYKFCKLNPLFKPLKGRDRQDRPWNVSSRSHFPGTNTPIPGGLQLYLINVNYYKDLLTGNLATNIDDPGAFVYHSGYTAEQQQLIADGKLEPFKTHPMEEFAKHFCSEHRTEDGIWLHDRSKGHNDYFDCDNYFLFHIDMLRVEEWPEPNDQLKTQRPKPGQGTGNAQNKRPQGGKNSSLPSWHRRG